MQTAQNIVRFRSPSIGQIFDIFLEELESKNTRKAYASDIQQFITFIFNKPYTNVTLEDLTKLQHSDVIQYKNHIAKQYNKATVNRKISSLRMAFQFIEKDYPEVRSIIFKVKRMKENDSQTYGVLSFDEIEEMINAVKSHPKGEIKSLLIETATITGIRLSSLLDLKWNENIFRKNGYWVISTIDKNKVHEKPITNSLYQRLRNIKTAESNRIFNLNKKTCQKMIQTLCNELGIDYKTRNIVFHSLKKSGICELYARTNGDLEALATQGNHSNIITTLKYYMDLNKDYSKYGSILLSQKIDFNEIANVSHEELLNAIKKCGSSVQHKILQQLKNKTA